MSQVETTLVQLGVALCVLAMPTMSQAQPGDHIRAGDAEIIPDVDIGMTYRTNVFRAEDNAQGAPNLHVSPGLRIESSSPDLSFSLGAEYLLRKYFKAPFTSADRYSDFAVDAKMEARKLHSLGFVLSDSASMMNSTVDMNGAIRNGGAYVSRLRNQLRGGVVVRPGPAMELTLGGGWGFDDYQVPQGAQITGSRFFNRRQSFGPTAAVRWTFFPRTAVVINSSYTLNRWDDNWILAIDDSPVLNEFSFGTHLAMPNSTHFKVDGGLQGRITKRLVLTMRGGYGSANYDEQSVIDDAADETVTDASELGEAAGFYTDIAGIDHLLLTGELRYELAPDTALTAGYSRDFDDSWFTNYVAYDRFYGRLKARMGSHLGLTAEGSFRLENYAGEGFRDDVVIRVGGDVSYYLSEWASLSAGAKWDERASTQSRSEYDDISLFAKAMVSY